ncbi:MAG: sugar phosphate isomerase/epimerase, partial [Armatimonadetes bacterium]|nr:sugar phosphate isomerase/epimerase [Armatimonadota bacterium]
KAAELVRDARAYAAEQGVPYFIESHRNTATETLPQTYELIRRVPDLTFTADLSHYFVVGEFYGWENERLPERLGPILERTVSIHGRISNGEQVQVDVGDGTGRLPQAYVEIWSLAMKAFLADARPGDVFPFTPELGPPAYAIVHPDGSGEISDRWQQSLVMAQLARQAWEKATP